MSCHVSLEIARAFREGRRRAIKATTCTGSAVYLHDHRIAWCDEAGTIWLSLCGWGSQTTRERLNAICEAFGFAAGFCQRGGVQYYNGMAISVHDRVPLCGPLTLLALRAGRGLNPV